MRLHIYFVEVFVVALKIHSLTHVAHTAYNGGTKQLISVFSSSYRSL